MRGHSSLFKRVLRTAKRTSGWWSTGVVLLWAATIGTAGSNPALVDAVKQSDVAAVRALLGQGVDVDAAEQDGTTALHWAASRDEIEIAGVLIDAGADVHATNRYGVTPLLLACTTGSTALVARLLEAGADPSSALPEGETALMTAARAGKSDVVRLLASRGADVDAREGWHQQTALMWAAAENHPAVIDTLADLGADLQARSEGGFTALLFAVRDGRIAATQALLERGADVNDVIAPDADLIADSRRNRPFSAAAAEGTSALVVAVTNAHYELVTHLLERGAYPDAAAQGWTALHQLQFTRRHTRSRGLPPPERTGTLDSLGMARALLAHGANPDARQTQEVIDGQRNILNRLGATPFLLAAKHADPAMMELLVVGGADPMLTNDDHTNALMAAAGVGIFALGESVGTNDEALEAVKMALQLADYDVNAADDNGWTAIHGAAVRGANSIVRLLVEKGADLEAKTSLDPSCLTSPPCPAEWTALQIADGVLYANTFKRAQDTAALLREMLQERGLPVPEVPEYQNAVSGDDARED